MKVSGPERVALAALAGFYFLAALGGYGLLNDNEGLYAEMVREIAAGGSAVALHLDGVPYLEKPPLLMWLSRGAMWLFGPSELALRAVPAAAGLLLVAATYLFASRVKDELTGHFAALILASSVMLVLVMRTLMPDSLLIALFSLSMYLFFLWHAERRRGFLVLSYGALALAVLAKGFVALALAGLVFVAFGATLRERPWRWRELLEPRALLAFLAVAAPWHVMLLWRHFDFGWFYLWHEHVLRYLGLLRPKDYYSGPIWYYLPRIVGGLLPWSVFLPLLARKGSGAAERFLWIWFGVALAFFSLSQAKANYYMFIAAAPLAILVAARITDAVRAGRHRTLLAPIVALVVLGAGVAAALDTAAWARSPAGRWIAQLQLHGPLLAAVGGFTVLAAIGALAAFRVPRVGLLAVGFAGAPLMLFFALAMHRGDAWLSERALARWLDSAHRGEPVLVYQDYERLSSLPFYLRRTLPVVDSRSSDLQFGERYAPSGLFLTDSAFTALARRAPVVLLVENQRLADFERRLARAPLQPEAHIGDVFVFASRSGRAETARASDTRSRSAPPPARLPRTRIPSPASR